MKPLFQRPYVRGGGGRLTVQSTQERRGNLFFLEGKQALCKR